MNHRLASILSLAFLLFAGGLPAPLTAEVVPASAFTLITNDWNPDPAIRELRMVGTRGGQASSQAVVLGRGPIQTEVGALSGPDGARLDGGIIQVRYAWTREPHALPDGSHPGVSGYQILAPQPDPDAARTPVWLTANIPADATPGTYRGEVQISYAGGTARLPLQLQIGSWRLPASKDFVSHVNLIYSPDSVALRYGVDPWSDAHFRLMEASLDWYASVGQDVFYVPFTLGTHFGTTAPLVRFVRRGDTLEPDFTALDRFAAQWKERVGTPRFTVFYIWCNNLGHDPIETVEVQVIDPDSGEIENVAVPYFGSEGAEAIWQPAIAGALERLRAAGFPDESLLLGIGHDRKPDERDLSVIRTLFPDREWNVISHGRGYGLHANNEPREGLRIAYHEYPWNPHHFPDVSERGLMGGWNLRHARATIARFHHHNNGAGNQRSHPVGHHLLAEATVSSHAQRNAQSIGFTRYKADFLRVPRQDDRGRWGVRTLLNMGGWVNLMRNSTDYLFAGEDGTLATVNFQHIIEGIHAVEARIAIEQVLADEERAAKIPEATLSQARQAINWRLQYLNKLRQGSMPEHIPAEDETALLDNLFLLYQSAGEIQNVAE
ncbi:MAG: hypothetical protein JJU29_00875 [Verrucomicrobia bacterium]|nr:hypothetical protein [Verrucomicrobiota bacterium]MCH8510540.1 hypothetical protein [Kiritimatiellia bacterium]